MYTHTHACTCTHTYTLTQCTLSHMYTHTITHLCTHTCMLSHVHTLTYLCAASNTHTCTHSHTRLSAQCFWHLTSLFCSELTFVSAHLNRLYFLGWQWHHLSAGGFIQELSQRRGTLCPFLEEVQAALCSVSCAWLILWLLSIQLESFGHLLLFHSVLKCTRVCAHVCEPVHAHACSGTQM